jgi:SAM-dependent methyltransferase
VPTLQLTPPPFTTYEEALSKERQIFEHCLNVHDLPNIFHYWSEKHLRPKLVPFGFDSPNAMFVKYLAELCEHRAGPVRFASLGSGNCDLEIELARKLRARGHSSFTIDCLDLNPSMLERGRLAAHRAGLSGHLEFVESDCNNWKPAHVCDAVIANQSLHHILNLEGLFEQVKKSLDSGGCFIISDMIGRNGHQRWPEALEIVHEFWRLLPPSYRFNLRSGRYEELFQDWDCSTEGFEGIRSQDVLPLLLQNFHFRLFVPFGNIIDPFIDRSFGHHFNPAAEWDRAFIDRVHARDEAGLTAGLLMPTHMLAVVGNDSCQTVFPDNLSPQFCLRTGDATTQTHANPDEAYDWFSWPHDAERELRAVCPRLGRSETREQDLLAWGEGLDLELTTRTSWALKLEKELEERTEWALRIQEELQQELDDRTTWARRLESELAERTAWTRKLLDEIEVNKSSAAWAHQLMVDLEIKNADLERKDAELKRKDQELYELHRHPFRSFVNVLRARIQGRLGAKDRQS